MLHITKVSKLMSTKRIMGKTIRRQLKHERAKTQAVVERLGYTSNKFMSAYATTEEYHNDVISLDNLLRQSTTHIQR